MTGKKSDERAIRASSHQRTRSSDWLLTNLGPLEIRWEHFDGVKKIFPPIFEVLVAPSKRRKWIPLLPFPACHVLHPRYTKRIVEKSPYQARGRTTSVIIRGATTFYPSLKSGRVRVLTEEDGGESSRSSFQGKIFSVTCHSF